MKELLSGLLLVASKSFHSHRGKVASWRWNLYSAARVQWEAMRGFRNTCWITLRLLLAVSLLAAVARAERVEDLPQPTDYVSDYAHVLSPQAIARIDSLCTQLDHGQANAQIAVVTVRTLDGDDSADYATRLFEKMKIGAKGTDRGVLLLFAIDDRKRSIKIGYGLGGILPDAKTGDIGRSVVPYLQAGDYDSAAMLETGQIAQVIASDAKVTLDESTQMPVRQPVRHGLSIGKVIRLIILLAIFGGFFGMRLLGSFGLLGMFMGGGFGGGFGGGGGYGGGDSGGGGGGFGGFGGGGSDGGGSDGSW
jgi:uncharacterized protein